MGNVGDAGDVLGKRVIGGPESNASTVVAERLCAAHNVGIDEVRKAMEALHPYDAHIVVHTRGVWRIKGIIQVQLLVLESSVWVDWLLSRSFSLYPTAVSLLSVFIYWSHFVGSGL